MRFVLTPRALESYEDDVSGDLDQRYSELDSAPLQAAYIRVHPEEFTSDLSWSESESAPHSCRSSVGCCVEIRLASACLGEAPAAVTAAPGRRLTYPPLRWQPSPA
jgi:hypothetical protein